jgi:hypothetical protein
MHAVCTCEFLDCPKSQLLTVLAFGQALKGTDSRFTSLKHDSVARPLATDWKFWSRMPESLSKTVRPILFVLVWASDQDSIDEWKTLVSVDTVPRDFSRLPDGSYEVFEEWQDAVQSLSLGF